MTQGMFENKQAATYAADTQAFREAEQMAKEYTCGCGEGLVIVRAANTWEAKCGTDRTHDSYRYAMTTTEVARSYGGPVHTVDAATRRFETAMTPDAMARIFKLKQPKLTKAGAYQAAIFALEMGLDPRANEIAVLEFALTGDNSKAQKVPQLMVTAKGWRRLAIRECGDVLESPPVVSVIRDAEERVAWGAEPDAWVAVARGFLRTDREGLPPREEPGIYTRRDYAADSKNAFKPAGKWPLNQAMVRAERKWYERNVPQALEYARQRSIAAMEREDFSKAEAAIAFELTPEREISLDE